MTNSGDFNWGYLNELWEFDPSSNEWAWMAGSSRDSSFGDQTDFGALPVYGVLGTPAAGNTPGGRYGAVSWIDGRGYLWLFGGRGVGGNGLGLLNDLWEFNSSTDEWAWMGGSSTIPQSSVYGTMGTPATGNIPGGREYAASWTDSNGNFWLFGGSGYYADGMGGLNDLWEFNPSTNEWTWMGGSRTGNQAGVYGTLGVPAAGNIPGSRYLANCWTDSSGNLWLFGGSGNELWEFNPSTNEWAWMGGSSTGNQAGVYGALGVPAAGNIPGGRDSAVSWTDNMGNLWLFGGDGYDANGNEGGLNDLWEYNPSTNQWTWMGGSITAGSDHLSGPLSPPGVYGTLGTPASGNLPGSRDSAVSWTDKSGNFWLFGGAGIDAMGNFGTLNDLWEYQPTSTPSFPATATPILSPATGTYSTTQTVTITDATQGAVIYYTTDGTTPTRGSTQYTSPIIVLASETIQAIAVATNYLNSALASASYTIPPNFTVSVNPASLTVQAGQSGTTTITVTDVGGFNSNVSFACSGLPAGTTCSFNPQTVTPSGAAATTTLTVSTSGTTATLGRNSSPLFPSAALAAVLCCLGWKKRRRLQMLLLLAVCGAGLSLLNGCGGGSSTSQSTTYTVTVTATSGSLQQSTTFSLTVN
jgi:N-acetylneuraminic acid mutarotase